MDNAPPSVTTSHTAGSEHVLESEYDGSTVSLRCSQVIDHVPPAGGSGGPLGRKPTPGLPTASDPPAVLPQLELEFPGGTSACGPIVGVS